MNKLADLYKRDFVLWAEEQARALRQAAHSGANLPLDWENLAEEIESLGRSDRRELGSRIQIVLQHLLKLECSPAIDPRAGWEDSVDQQRDEISRLLRNSPSLRGEIGRIVGEELPTAIALVERQLARYGELTEAVKSALASAAYKPEQVLSDWWPETRA